MDWVSQTVASFGQSMGIQNLSLDSDGCALFTLEPGGSLSLQDLQLSGGDDVLITLAKPLPVPQEASIRRALLMADFRVNPTWETQLAFQGGELMVTLRVPRHSFLASTLEEAVEALFNFHGRLAQSH